MRTTIDLPDRLLREAKAAAAIEGRSLKDFITDAVERRLASGGSANRRRVRLPLVTSSRPGSVALTGDAVARLLEEDDAPS
jgi:hypothetical protein